MNALKNFWNNLTGVAQFLIIVVVVSLIGLGVYNNSDAIMGISEKQGSAKEKVKSLVSFDKPDVILLCDTYTGWSPIVWANGGYDVNKESMLYKKFGLKVQIKNADDFDGATSFWKENKNALRFCTLDSYPVEASASGTMTDARYYFIHNFSAGADAIVATGNIKTVADLKGKTIVCSEGTASHSLLLNTLDAAGLKNSDVKIVTTGYGADVATAFKAGVADAAVVFCPDDAACIKDGPKGTHVLVSTKQINTLVTDGFLAHSDWLKDNPKTAKTLAEALLWANAEMMKGMPNDSTNYKAACKAFSDATEVPYDDVLLVGGLINFATLEDNINWFGLNTDYTGITGEGLYTKMSQVYGGIGLAKATLPWRKISDVSIVESLVDNNSFDNDQSACGTKSRKFDAPTQKVIQTASFSDKQVIINFPVNGASLDADAQTIIDREFLGLVKQFNNCYIRVEGNTDDTGSYDNNVKLSKMRAQSVADYLVKNGIDANRLIVKGNGTDHAKRDGVKGYNDAYRTTSVQLVQM